LQDSQDVVIRQIELQHVASKTTRTVTQYHYNKWPDFGVPSEPTTFLSLLEKVKIVAFIDTV
jgi:protein tyrosine phosphatase